MSHNMNLLSSHFTISRALHSCETVNRKVNCGLTPIANMHMRLETHLGGTVPGPLPRRGVTQATVGPGAQCVGEAAGDAD